MMDVFAGGVMLLTLAVLVGLWAFRKKGSDDEKND